MWFENHKFVGGEKAERESFCREREILKERSLDGVGKWPCPDARKRKQSLAPQKTRLSE
jgi:hypothetical protein